MSQTGSSERPPLSIAEARRLGQGSAHLDQDPTYARLFLRRISPSVSWAIVRYTGLSADAVTASWILIGIAGGLLVAVGSVASDLAAVALLQVSYLLDIADGEVARIRGTSGRRGSYLDLIGHFVVNRALYAAASLSLLRATDGAWWAIVVGFLVMAFASPFGHYARLHVGGAARAPAEHPDHGRRVAAQRPRGADPGSWAAWLYRHSAFVFHLPASMNLFCVALLADASSALLSSDEPIAIPVLIAVFGPALAAKQIAHAIRLLWSGAWAR